MASIRVAGEQLGPCTPQLAKKGRGLRDAGWCPSGLALAAWRALEGARRRLLLGALGKGAAIPLGLLAISGSIVLMPVGLEPGFRRSGVVSLSR